MLICRTMSGILVKDAGRSHRIEPRDWDAIFAAPDPAAWLGQCEVAQPSVPTPQPQDMLAPIGSQEVWAAGVTYYRSRTARMAESESAGGGSFYDRVYEAERPELFMKATPHRVVPPGGAMHLRRDSKWIVPEPELTLAISSSGKVFGYTIGNDLSCRDIEGENPLYLPQAKVFDGCASIGPGILVRDEALPDDTAIDLQIVRDGETAYTGTTNLSDMKRKPEELAGWLCREMTFPTGCFLMTGTGIIPPDEFSLRAGDEVRITIEPIGTLTNTVE